MARTRNRGADDAARCIALQDIQDAEEPPPSGVGLGKIGRARRDETEYGQPPMRIAVVTSSPLFAEGGHLVIARELVGALRAAGHEADLVLTPQNRFGRQGTAYLSTWLQDLEEDAAGRPVDQVISFRYPSFAARHPRHVCWLNHRMREYYDLWPRFRGSLSRRARVKETARRWILHRVDNYLLTRNVTKVFAQSKTIQARLQRWGRIPSEVLYPPPPARSYRTDAYDPYLFSVSRLTPLKRIDLVLRALAEPACANVRAVIAGDGEALPGLLRLRAQLGLEQRVEFTGKVDDAQVLGHLARCRAVVFAPYAEDYGFVTAEAFSCAKPVITCTDSGGPAELVRHGETGLIAAPEATELAAAIQRVMDDEAAAIRFGEAAAAIAATLTWPNTVDRLLLRS